MKLKSTLAVLFGIILLMCSGGLFAFTAYTDMSVAEDMIVRGYSYTDINASDWHYSPSSILMRSWDPNGVETSNIGGGTFASIARLFTVDGNYSFQAKHSIFCSFYGAFLTPITGGNIFLSISLGTYSLSVPGQYWAAYAVCPEHIVACSSLAVAAFQLPSGVPTWPPFLDVVTINVTGPVPVCFILETTVASGC